MTTRFAPLRRTLAAVALAALCAGAAAAQTPPPGTGPADNGTPPPLTNKGQIPAGGHFKECHGYIRHISDLNIKVHCIDGDASDQSFLYFPKYANLHDGKSVQTKDLLPETPVHVIYTQSLGIKKAYKIYVADPNGNGLYGFRT
jgi:hypothetical protein